MDWTNIINELRSAHMTLQQISDKANMSKGQVHDLQSGRTRTVAYETGVKLVDMHRRVMRKRGRAIRAVPAEGHS